MSKQEEIREGLQKIRASYFGELAFAMTDEMLRYLDSQGVKIETKAWIAHGVVSTVYESLIKES